MKEGIPNNIVEAISQVEGMLTQENTASIKSNELTLASVLEQLSESLISNWKLRSSSPLRSHFLELGVFNEEDMVYIIIRNLINNITNVPSPTIAEDLVSIYNFTAGKGLSPTDELVKALNKVNDKVGDSNFNQVMLDIETLGTEPGCVVLSIGAVLFDMKSGETSTEFVMNIDIKDSLAMGLQISADTLKWWLAQGEEATKRAFSEDNDSLIDTLSQFSNFIDSNGGSDLKIWGNGARFDMGIVNDLYRLIGQPIPWNNFKERDVRTLVDFAPEVKTRVVKEAKKQEEVLHDPIVDCKVQIKYCSEIFNKITVA